MPILTFSVFEKEELLRELSKKRLSGGVFKHYTDKRTFSVQVTITNEMVFSNNDLFPLVIILKEDAS